jgi:hypothetical protein
MKYTTTALWKRLTGAAMALVLGAGVAAAQVNVTIQVDMTPEVGTFTTVHAPGSWNGFDPTGALMTNIGGNVYEITFSVPAGTQQIYKIVKDGSYANEESVPAACGLPNGFGTFDRAITPSADETVAFCWASCVSCSATTTADVTFIVNLGNVVDNPLGAHIAGDFNGFTPTAMAPVPGPGDLYQITYTGLVSGNNLRYKFLNGDNFSLEESVDSTCGIPNGFGGFDREFVVPGSDTTIGPICFGECADCVISCSVANPPQNPRHDLLTDRVRLEWDPVANTVACQVSGTRLVPPGPSPVRTVPGVEARTSNVPFTLAGGGTTWSWRVRCACQTTPEVIGTAFSVRDTFIIPAARMADMAELNIELFPNPAVENLNAILDATNSGQAVWSVVDMLGRTISSGEFHVEAGRNTLPLSVNGMENGMYFLRTVLNGQEQVSQFTVTR